MPSQNGNRGRGGPWGSGAKPGSDIEDLRELEPTRREKIAEPPKELHREKCNHYRRILASTVPNYIQPRPVIVPWSSLYRARLGA